MKLDYYLRRVRELPPRETIKRTLKLCRNQTLNFVYRLKDRYCTSYAENSSIKYLHRYFPKLQLSYLKPHEDQIYALADHFLEHQFDLLGSGWVQVKHGMRCHGLEGYRYDMGDPIQTDTEGKWLEGRINKATLPESQRIWKLIFRSSAFNNQSKLKTSNLKPNIYIPIDWHLDFKSGYRWSESAWYQDVPFGHKLGVDIKVPWELARMQHLSQFAFAYALGNWEAMGNRLEAIEQKEGGSNGLMFKERGTYVIEFRNQVLDFIATNPPRFGVNWSCTMDVAIRIVNWLVAYDLFRAYGAEFDQEFENIFIRSVYEHGRHIINNLEWDDELRANHYLSNIVGLLFVAAYLPRTPEIDAWLAFAVQELVKEVKLQFYLDGANFEASTSYHRLSAEMVIYATALLLGMPLQKTEGLRSYDHTLINVKPGLEPPPLPLYAFPTKNTPKSEIRDPCSAEHSSPGQSPKYDESPFPFWHFERLEKMAEFTMHISKPNSHIPQIGDNDSGRFLKLQPVYLRMTVSEAIDKYLNLQGYNELSNHETYWDEEFLDHRHLVSAINGLFGREDFAVFTGEGWLETKLIQGLAGGIRIPSYHIAGEPASADRMNINKEEALQKFTNELGSIPKRYRHKIEIPLPGGDLRKGLKLYAYSDFGLYIYHSERLYLAIRCGSIGQNGKGGHAHNDQLSIELNVNGKDLIVDPGTYLYTPLPKRRNQFRSVKAHNTMVVEDIEQNKWPSDRSGLFTMISAISYKILELNATTIALELSYQDVHQVRYLGIMEDSILIDDYSNASFESNVGEFNFISNGYGKLVKSNADKKL